MKKVNNHQVIDTLIQIENRFAEPQQILSWFHQPLWAGGLVVVGAALLGSAGWLVRRAIGKRTEIKNDDQIKRAAAILNCKQQNVLIDIIGRLIDTKGVSHEVGALIKWGVDEVLQGNIKSSDNIFKSILEYKKEVVGALKNDVLIIAQSIARLRNDEVAARLYFKQIEINDVEDIVILEYLLLEAKQFIEDEKHVQAMEILDHITNCDRYRFENKALDLLNENDGGYERNKFRAAELSNLTIRMEWIAAEAFYQKIFCYKGGYLPEKTVGRFVGINDEAIVNCLKQALAINDQNYIYWLQKATESNNRNAIDDFRMALVCKNAVEEVVVIKMVDHKYTCMGGYPNGYVVDRPQDRALWYKVLTKKALGYIDELELVAPKINDLTPDRDKLLIKYCHLMKSLCSNLAMMLSSKERKEAMWRGVIKFMRMQYETIERERIAFYKELKFATKRETWFDKNKIICANTKDAYIFRLTYHCGGKFEIHYNQNSKIVKAFGYAVLADKYKFQYLLNEKQQKLMDVAVKICMKNEQCSKGELAKEAACIELIALISTVVSHYDVFGKVSNEINTGMSFLNLGENKKARECFKRAHYISDLHFDDIMQYFEKDPADGYYYVLSARAHKGETLSNEFMSFVTSDNKAESFSIKQDIFVKKVQ